MTVIERSALVAHPPLDMFRLVRDVRSYPDFLSWCSGARILEESDTEQLATLEVSIAGVRQGFTTRNRLEEPRAVDMELEEGPFRQLNGGWRFDPVGGDGCRVTLRLEFEFSNRLLAMAFQRGFARVADRLVDDFSARADAVYGS